MKKIIPLFLLCGCGLINNIELTDYVRKDVPKYPEHLRTVEAFLGYNENDSGDRAILKDFMNIDPVHYEWCAAFVNAVLHLENIPGSESVHENPLMARSFLAWGQRVETPKLGDVVVFQRGNSNWKGHVGFYMRTVRKDGKEYYLIAGGNQNDQVSYELYPTSKVLSIRRWVESS